MATALAERFPISTVASLTGVSPITLRAWERRYGLVRPLRTKKGHRLYTHEHVERVRRALALLERGLRIGQVRGLLDQEAAPEAADGNYRPWLGYLERLSGAVASFDQAELDRIYDEALSLYPIEQVTRELLLPSLVRLGERWQKVPGAIAEEHFLTGYVRSKLGARVQHRARYVTGARFLAACAPGEPHELGLLLFSLEAQEVGLQPIITGGNTPFEELIASCGRARCRAIVISSTVEPAPQLLSRELARLVTGAQVPVFVGGATAVRSRSVIQGAGAIPLGTDSRQGVRLLQAALAEPTIAPA
jgi:MerR family transcriptional regulator, light-induced transcriptional regulator